MMKIRLAILRCLTLLTFVASILGPLPAAQAQPLSQQTTTAETILTGMTPEERVGQLFLVTFSGITAGPDSQIYDLIVNHHIGGVVLQAANNNFVAQPDTISSARQLVNTLQGTEWDTTALDLNTQNPNSVYIPLFIGISQEGGGSPNDQILSGLTPLPSAMAIGATWKPELAQQVGQVLGSELSALGFNLFFGPSLDVVESPNPSVVSDLGTRVFGGDPFWVGEMGRAFIAGLHNGSDYRMMVVAKHFPGRGSSDRLPEEEVATVRKSLEQLKQIELSPFFAVTNSNDPANVVDGLLVSHIRYQGFQGNIRATTRPVSFDASALPAILALPEFIPWRDNGGLIVSDSLGSAAVRTFYSQVMDENFSPRVVARDAFSAGNELLYLGNINSGTEGDDTYSTTLRILDYFAQEYGNDPVFAQRVDAAVLRILSQKIRMYGDFTISNVVALDVSSASLGVSQQVMFDVARNAATLVSPDPQELSTLLPSPPGVSDRIVFLTDTSTKRQCSTCPVEDDLAVDALQRNVARLYGQSGSAQILLNRLSSYSLTELRLMLNGESETDIEDALTRATWIVISLANVDGDQLTILRRFFAERPNLINKNVILFSFTAPYYLDATDISKLTAHYALYSKQPAFLDVAARLLFQQLPLQGVSPVSIPAMEYSLIVATSPNPAQIIPLALDIVSEEVATPSAETPTLEPTQIPLYRIGDTIAVKAGPILDHNNHIVPDRTVVRFTLSTRDESGGILRQEDALTSGGIARATFVIDKPGNVEIRAISEPALSSGVVQIIASNEGVAVTIATLPVTPTITEVPPSPTAVSTEPVWVTVDGYPRMSGWFLTLLAVFGSAFLTYWAVSRLVSTRWGVRWAFCLLIGGLLGYNYLALGFPGVAQWVAEDAGVSGILVLTFGGEVVGSIAALLWMRWVSESELRAG